MSDKNIKRLYNVVYNSVGAINGKLSFDRIMDALERLVIELEATETDESIWHIGEFNEFALDTLIVGAYWFFSNYSMGQTSRTYELQCILGRMFSPRLSAVRNLRNLLGRPKQMPKVKPFLSIARIMTDGPEDGSGEQVAYKLLELSHTDRNHHNKEP